MLLGWIFGHITSKTLFLEKTAITQSFVTLKTQVKSKVILGIIQQKWMKTVFELLLWLQKISYAISQ